MDRVALISGSSNEPLANAVASHLNIPLTPTNFTPFPSGESRVEILSSIRNRSVFIIQSGYTLEPTSPSPNDHIMQTVMLADACHRASAREIILVMPCLPYAEEPEDIDQIDPDTIECETELQTFLKKDIFPSASIPLPQREFYYQLKEKQEAMRALNPVDPIPIFTHPDPFKLIASLLQCSGASHLLTLHLPRPQVVGYFDIPVDNLSIVPLLSNLNLFEKYTIATSDISLAKQASQIAKSLHIPFTLLHRLPSKKCFDINSQEVADKHILLIDEPRDRVFQAGKELKSLSPASVSLLILHLIPSNENEILKLQNPSEFDRIFIINSIRIPDTLKSCEHIEIIDLAPFLAKTIESLQLGDSLQNMKL